MEKQSYALMSFVAGKKLYFTTLKNSLTDEQFKAIITEDSDGNRISISFSSKLNLPLEEQTPQFIQENKHKLRVYITDGGNYKLCMPDSSWEELVL